MPRSAAPTPETILEQLPEAASRFATGLARLKVGQVGNLQKIQNAATEVETATAQAAGGSEAPRQPATHVIVDQPKFKVGNFLWDSSLGALGAMGQAAMVVFLVFFLMLGGGGVPSSDGGGAPSLLNASSRARLNFVFDRVCFGLPARMTVLLNEIDAIGPTPRLQRRFMDARRCRGVALVAIHMSTLARLCDLLLEQRHFLLELRILFKERIDLSQRNSQPLLIGCKVATQLRRARECRAQSCRAGRGSMRTAIDGSCPHPFTPAA